MLVFTPYTPQTYIYSRDAFSQAEYLESMTRQAAREYAEAHARVQAIQRQREREAYHRHQAQAAYLNCVSDVHSRHAAYPQRAPARQSVYYFEELALGVRREEVRRRNLEVQRQRAIAEAAALEEARRRAHALEVQRKKEQERVQAQQVQQQEAFVAFLGMMAQVATQVQTPQPGPSSRQHGIPVSAPAPEPAAKPVDRKGKGKGKAVEVPVNATGTPASVPTPVQPSHEAPTLKEELEARIRKETDPDVRESLLLLYSDLFDARRPAATQPAAGPSQPKQTRFRVPVEESARSSSSSPSSVPKETTPAPQPASETPKTEGAPLHRTHALPPAVAAKLLKFYRARRARKLSLDEIKQVEDALRKLEETFEFPEHLDFVNPVLSDATSEPSSDEPGRLAFSPNNTPVHAYEHALNALLTRLDAVESNGDLEVRGRRKEVVREVERALEVVERRVEESRERERERSRERRASSALSVEVDAAPAVPAEQEEVKEEAPVVEPTPVSETASVVEDAVTAPVTTEEVSEEAPTVANSSMDAVEPEAPSAEAEVAPDTDNTAAQDVPVVPSPVETTPGPAEVSEEVPVVAEDTAADVSREEPLAASAPEDVLPSDSIASPTTDTQTPEMISRTISSATDATFATADIELPPTPDDVTAPDTQGQAPEPISRIASSATDTTDVTFVTADTEIPPTPPSDSAEATPSSPTPEPMSRTDSSASEEAFLLSSTPLADEPKRRASDASAEDEMEIISKEELEVARNDSDWSDLDSDA